MNGLNCSCRSNLDLQHRQKQDFQNWAVAEYPIVTKSNKYRKINFLLDIIILRRNPLCTDDLTLNFYSSN